MIIDTIYVRDNDLSTLCKLVLVFPPYLFEISFCYYPYFK